MWNSKFMIGNGDRTTDETAKPVYRNYLNECGIVMTQEEFNRIIKVLKFKIYYETEVLKNIVFTPKDVIKQTTSNYYFLHLDVKVLRTH